MQIKYQDVNFIYHAKTPFQSEALKNVNVVFNHPGITTIVGKTGSGKSTLASLINYLTTPTSGQVNVDDFINAPRERHKHKEVMNLRRQIGYLFQSAEKQLFADTVIKDVVFALNNFYPKNKDNLLKAQNALKLVGLDESFYNRSPLDLSGGEKKKVAIAGVIAYQPKLLILDEPTAGLDGFAKKELLLLLKKINATGVAIIIITHDMDVVLKYADQVVVMMNGEIKKVVAKKEIFKDEVEKYGLISPQLIEFAKLLKANGKNINLDNITDISSLIQELRKNE